MNFFTNLKQKIETKEAVIGVIGLGYVGLPLALEMVDAGFTVIGIDQDQEKVSKLCDGISYIQDVSQEAIEKSIMSNRFHPTTSYEKIMGLDAISICVPTPLSHNQEPDTSYISNAVAQIKKYIKSGVLITLESTTYPGTTEELVQWELEKMGFVAGENLFVCFSPERVDPGNVRFKIRNTPKVVGGTTENCVELGSLLYGSFVEQIVSVSSTQVAEMSKLLENTFRSINIAFINEMAMMCEKMEIDVWEVIQAASTKPFGFMPFYPGPGIGGHCIPLDPMYLSWKAKGFRFYSKFIELAQAVNNNMPDYVLSKTAQVLNVFSKSVNKAQVLLLGMAYKPDVDDLRESPGLYIYDQFKQHGATVHFYDPHAHSFQDNRGNAVYSVDYNLEAFKKYDCMVLITNHKEFRLHELARIQVPIVDTRNAFQSFNLPHIYKLGSPTLLNQNQLVSP